MDCVVGLPNALETPLQMFFLPKSLPVKGKYIRLDSWVQI